MDNRVTLAVRSVDFQAVRRFRDLSTATRLPLGALLEDAIDLLCESYDEPDEEEQEEHGDGRE